MFDSATKRLRDDLFDLCNAKRLSAVVTTKIMDSGPNHFSFGDLGEVMPLDARWGSLAEYVSENANHLSQGNVDVLGHKDSLTEKDKLLLILDECAKSGNMTRFRAVRKQYKEAIG